MALPPTLRVKLSSEAAGSISLSPVVVREMPLRELVELMLGFHGKDVARVCELLRRGSLVSGASRFRWEGWEADPAEVRALLATFPDPDPTLPFSGERSTRAVFLGARARIDLPREAGARRRWLRRRSFWDAVAEVVCCGEPVYAGYSYKERADCYRMALSRQQAARLRACAPRLVYSSLGEQFRTAELDAVELYVPR